MTENDLQKSELLQKSCKPCEGGVPPLDAKKAEDMLKQIPEWQLKEDFIEREFKFKNYYHTMAFVNAIAWIAHKENHHPDLEVGYNHCKVRFSTHAINGLSENDFICAAKINELI